MRTIIRFCKNQSGATAIEYALIASFIALGILLSVNSLGSGIASFFTMVKNKLPQ